VGRLLDYLDDKGLTENTLVVYTSDQGFFLGDHGWYDKRFMYEESLRMPLVMRYPAEIVPGTANQDMICNVDFAPLFLDVAGIDIPAEMQGRSFRSMFAGQTPDNWREALYYRYWMHKAHHNVYAHYGIRTHDFKLIYYYSDSLGQEGAIDETYEPEWELFDLKQDPYELNNVYHDPAYGETVKALTHELHRLQDAYGDVRYEKDN
jgi:arylsulfatase A-like enzyme